MMNRTDTADNTAIASLRVYDNATVRVLNLRYNTTLTCSRECIMLKEGKDGAIRCGLEKVSNIAAFQTHALMIDFEVIMDRDSSEDWRVFGSCFKVIDDSGHIHEGKVLCDEMVSPEKYGAKEYSTTLYPGTREVFQIYFDGFPKEGKVSSIIAEWSDRTKTRIDFERPGDSSSPVSNAPNQPWDRTVFNPRNPGDLFERIDRLEDAVRELQDRVKRLSGGESVSAEPVVEIPVSTEEKPLPKVEVNTIEELLSLDPVSFREVAIQILQGQGFKNIITNSDPNIGYSSMTGNWFGNSYAIMAIPAGSSGKMIEVKHIQRLLDFQEVHMKQKAILITSCKISREAQTEAYSHNVELLDRDRIALMLPLRESYSGYKPL